MGECLKLKKTGKILDFGVVENYKMKGIISRQIRDSPPPKQGDFELISELTG